MTGRNAIKTSNNLKDLIFKKQKADIITNEVIYI